MSKYIISDELHQQLTDKETGLKYEFVNTRQGADPMLLTTKSLLKIDAQDFIYVVPLSDFLD